MEGNTTMWILSPPLLIFWAVPLVWLVVSSFASWASSFVGSAWKGTDGPGTVRNAVHNGHEEKQPNSSPAAWGGQSRYGLALGESQEPDVDADEDDLTMDEIRRLQTSNAFRVFCKVRGITHREVESIEQRLQTYRRLRTLHPSSLLMMCNPRSLVAWEALDPGIVFRFIEYVLTTVLHVSITLAAVLYAPWTVPSDKAQSDSPFQAFTFLLICPLLVLLPPLYSRPSVFAAFFSAWYVDLEYEHKATAHRCILANLLETVYVIATFGIGGLVSLAWRCSSIQQSMGERIAGVRMIIEKKKVWRPSSAGG